MSETINILNKADTLKAIRSIKGKDGTLRGQIQTALIGALAHAAEHGDTGLLAKLVLAVNKTSATQLRKFITAHAPVKWNKEGKFTKVKSGGAYRVSDALENNWFEFEKAPRAAAAFDGTKALAKVRATLENQALAAAEAGDIVTANTIIAAYEALDTIRLAVVAA